MQNFDRRAHWENVYELKNATEVSWFQAQPVTSLELIANCGLDLYSLNYIFAKNLGSVLDL